MEKEKLYSLEVAIEALQTFYLNALHKEKKIKMKIKTPPMESVLAWFDPNDDGLYITSDLSRWSPELLYVLPLHENTHKVLHGLVENYENGYHNIAFRDFFEKYSGMRTYNDEKLGWQFIQDVGDKYIAWLEKQKEVLNEIFRIIKNTDLPKKENEQEGENGGQEGENGGQEGESEAEKMNKILRQNSGDQDGEQEAGESNEQSGQEGEQEGGQSDGESNEKSDQESEQEGGQNDESDDQEGESGEQENEKNGEYEGQKQDVVLKGGKKKFRL
jgi:hypothetical protein